MVTGPLPPLTPAERVTWPLSKTSVAGSVGRVASSAVASGPVP